MKTANLFEANHKQLARAALAGMVPCPNGDYDETEFCTSVMICAIVDDIEVILGIGEGRDDEPLTVEIRNAVYHAPTRLRCVARLIELDAKEADHG